jgi:hypothetical protein
VKSGKMEGSNEMAKRQEVICLDSDLQSESQKGRGRESRSHILEHKSPDSKDRKKKAGPGPGTGTDPGPLFECLAEATTFNKLERGGWDTEIGNPPARPETRIEYLESIHPTILDWPSHSIYKATETEEKCRNFEQYYMFPSEYWKETQEGK